MSTTPLFDKVFEQSESQRSVRPRSILSQPVSPVRKTDPETCEAAASVPADIRGEQRINVYRYLVSCGARGATDYEIGQALNILRTSAGKRRKELLELGYVVDSGERRRTDTNQSAIVWRLK